MTKYRASKTLAEKAAWEYYNAHKSEVKWDITFINPPFVFGPGIQEITSVATANLSLKTWIDMVVGTDPRSKEVLASSNFWIDVRDLADAHVLALEKEAAGGERIIVAEGPYVWQDFIDIANDIAPSAYPSRAGKLPKGFPEIQQEKEYKVLYDTSKAQRILGLKYRSKEQTTRDTLEDLERRGW